MAELARTMLQTVVSYIPQLFRQVVLIAKEGLYSEVSESFRPRSTVLPTVPGTTSIL